jgi:shikimate dehydrogenase
MTAPIRSYAEVIGDPISHSKSPLIHGFWLEKLGLTAEYNAAHIEAENLGDYFLKRVNDPDWRGCNITLPHKVAALEHVTDPGGVRHSIGAINTVIRGKNGELIGTNTDAAGFYSPIADFEIVGKEAIIIGTGGAARAILFALAQADVAFVTLLSRNPLKGVALLAQFGLKGQVLALDARIPPANLLVNASPLGMKGQAALEIDISPLFEDALVYDIVYAPVETDLLRAAKARELATVDGLEMLVGQAACAFELFFGVAPPGDGDAELRELLLK